MPGEPRRGTGFGLGWRTRRVPSPEIAAHVCCLRQSRVVRGAQSQATNEHSTDNPQGSTSVRATVLTHCATRARHYLQEAREPLAENCLTLSRLEYLNHALRRTGGDFPRDALCSSRRKTRKLRAAFRQRLVQSLRKLEKESRETRTYLSQTRADLGSPCWPLRHPRPGRPYSPMCAGCTACTMAAIV